MRKKLFAILMSAMMMVTFMPTMAFAAAGDDDANAKWAADYSYVTVDGVKYDAVRAIADKAHWDGKITASVDTKYGVEAPEVTSVDFYDLSAATVSCFKNGSEGEFGLVFNYDTFQNLFKDKEATEEVWVVFTEPSYVQGYDATDKAVSTAAALTGKTLKMTMPNYDTAKKYEAQSFSLTVAATNDTSVVKLIGTVPAYSFQVKAKTVDLDDVEYLIDGKYSSIDYDGADHAVLQEEIPGVTSTYTVYNPATGLDETVDGITVNAAKTYNFKAVAAKGTAKTSAGYEDQSVTVVEANLPTMQFDTSDAAGHKEFNVSEGFDVAKYLVLAPYTGSRWHPVSADKQAADKKAIAANEELLKAYFNDFFTVEQTADKYDANKITAKIVAKDLTALTTAEKDALVEKYASMFANFGVSLTRGNITTARLGRVGDTATFNVTGSDIEWTKAPLTKTYHNKKGALKKTHYFTVKAVAGSTVTYKLTNGGSYIKINKTTGKITVKKGLKKGTYSVKVTAKTSKESDTYTLKVKVTK